jgi:hypothetical protein
VAFNHKYVQRKSGTPLSSSIASGFMSNPKFTKLENDEYYSKGDPHKPYGPFLVEKDVYHIKLYTRQKCDLWKFQVKNMFVQKYLQNFANPTIDTFV